MSKFQILLYYECYSLINIQICSLRYHMLWELILNCLSIKQYQSDIMYSVHTCVYIIAIYIDATYIELASWYHGWLVDPHHY